MESNACVKECGARKYRDGDTCSSIRCSNRTPQKISLNGVCVDVCDNFVVDSTDGLQCVERCSGHGWEWSDATYSNKFNNLQRREHVCTDRCASGYATREGNFKGTAQCTSSCSSAYPYVTQWGTGSSKMCNQWCEYYMEVQSSVVGRKEKQCKDYYECDALVPQEGSKNSQCYQGTCPEGYSFAYAGEKVCASRCDIYVLSALGGTSAIAEYTCYQDACPAHAPYRIVRDDGVECVQVCEDGQVLDGDTCRRECGSDRPFMYRDVVASLGKALIRCVETCSTGLFPRASGGLAVRAYVHSDGFCNSTPCAVSERDNVFGEYDATRTYQKCVRQCDGVVWFAAERIAGAPGSLGSAENVRNSTLGFTCQASCREGEHAGDARAYVRQVNVTLRNRQYALRLCQPYCSESQFRRLPESQNALLLTRDDYYVSSRQLWNGEPLCVAGCGEDEPFVSRTDARTSFPMCVAQCPGRAYDAKLLCVDECEGLYVVNGAQRMCVEACPDSSPYKNGFECVKNCGEDAFHVVSADGERTCAKTCVGLVDESENARKCVQSCPWGSFEGKCVSKCPENTFLKDGECVSSCGADSAVDEETGACSANCLRVDGKCVPACPADRPLWAGMVEVA